MTTLGQSFGFYIKYFDEMEQLYPKPTKSGALLLERYTDRDEKEEMIKKVGDRACEQAASFLMQCGKLVEKHFAKFCLLSNTSRRATVKRKWGVKIRLRPCKSQKRGKYKWEAGVWVDYYRQPGTPQRILVYLWAAGGSEAEDKLAKILKKKACRSAELFDWGAGSVIIEAIPIEVKELRVNEQDLLTQIQAALNTVGKSEIDKLFKI